MNIQDIELLFNLFNQQANNVKEQLTTFLMEVSDGKVPSANDMSAFNADMIELRDKYDGIYAATKEITSVDEIPAKGKNVSIYVEVAKKSRVRLLQEQIKQAKVILTRFIAIKSKLDVYNQALKPYQDVASDLLSQISEETINNVLAKMVSLKAFVDAMEFENIGSSVEGLTLMREVSKYYSWEVQIGLISNQYYFDTENFDTDVPTPNQQKSVVFEENTVVGEIISEYISSTPTDDIPSDVMSVLNDDNIEDTLLDDVQLDAFVEEVPNSSCTGSGYGTVVAEEAEIVQRTLTASNKLKRGTPSASSFKKEIVKIAKVNKEVRTVLPLLTNLGILTKEQCFLFGACMNCYKETDQFREYVSFAIDALVAKGYIACFEYEIDGEKSAAYCISNYCDSCMRKESIISQLKSFWSLSFGNYKFPSDTEVEKISVFNAIRTNDLLLKYIYAVKETLTDREFFTIKSSITWKDKYYQVAVYEDSKLYTCHLVNATENINEIKAKNILLCIDGYATDAIDNTKAEKIFILDQGTVYLLGGDIKQSDASDTDLEPTPIEDSDFTSDTSDNGTESDNVVKESIDDSASKPESVADALASEQVKSLTKIDDTADAGIETEGVATTPLELLQKKTIPTDDEFCNVIFNILNRESTTQEQLKSTIINAVLLANGAGLQKEYTKSSALSLKLRLATNVLIREFAYTYETLTTAFPNIDSENEAMALAAYLFAMLVPARPFDYGLANQTEALFRDYEIYFTKYEAFKPLFNKLMFVKKVSAAGFTPASIALLGSDEESVNFLAELKKQATQYLTIQDPKTRMKVLPIFYGDCFGAGSDLNACMTIIAENSKEDLEIVQMVLAEFSDVQNDTYVLNDEKIANYLDAKWSSKNSFKLAYDAYSQAFKQFKIRLEVMLDWTEHISKLNSNQKDLSLLRSLKNELLNIIQSIMKDNSWKKQTNANVLLWMLRYMQKYLMDELSKAEMYSDLLFTGVISLDDDGVPVIDETMSDIKFYEPWRNALRHIVAIKKSAEDLKAEIRGDILEDTDEEAGLKDNLHQLVLIGKFLKSEDEDYFVSDDHLREAIASADDRTIRFKETLELAYTYNQINETEKETLSGIMTQYKEVFYDSKDFASWRRFLEALELQIQELAADRKIGLRAKLDTRLKKDANSPLLKEADRLLEEDKNFAVTEEYITRFDSGETELENELDVILHDKDYFGEFLERDSFDDLLRICQQGKGRALKNFGWNYVERMLPKDWTSRNKDDSRNMINSWPSRKDAATPAQIKTLFKSLGFNVIGAVRKQGYKEDLFQISVRPTAKSMADYRHPIASFGTRIKNTINVIMVDANYTPRQLVDSISSLDLGGISIVLYNQPMDAVGRRLVGEIFHTQTSGQNPFLLIDQILFLYLAMHQETERMPALLKCTLPYTTYQPFVRDGGSTTDEMFCGRSQELATIIDPNGACVVYGGRQLGKTALLERAESRCSKPESKEYAVYSTIIRIDNETEVVETLIVDIYRKTNGKVKLTKCKTLKEMCYQLSEMFRNRQISTMYLLIDEVDCFLAAIANEAYRPIQGLVDLKRETKNNFKFVLTGLHNVCRAKNATKENGIFGQLGTPLCIKPLSPTDALKLLSRPLSYLGFQIDRYPHLETILTNTNYYPGILQFFGYMLVETLTGQYAKYYSAVDGNPPFTLQDEQLGAVMNSSDLNKSIKDKFRWSLELDVRYFMIARCITMLYHLYEKDRTVGSWIGFKVKDIREMSEFYNIHCLENESVDSFANLLDEMVEMGILSQPTVGFYRLRRSSFVDIIGENMDTLEGDIINNNEVNV